MKKKIGTVLAVALALGASASNVLRILPLGDSITYGQGWDPHGGYRAVLREQLTDAGYAVDYVGTQTANAGTLGAVGDFQHEGHPGWRITQLADNVAAWSSRFHAPHVILLKIGTNDCNRNQDQTMAETSALLDELRRCQPSAHVIVGTLITFLDGTSVGRNDAWVREHNVRLRAEVVRRAAAGERISLADLYPAVSPTQGMNDDRHPNETGYRAMAAVWREAIRAAFPDPTAERAEPELAAVRATVGETGRTVRIDFNAPLASSAASPEHFLSPSLDWSAVRLAEGGQGVELTVRGGLPPAVVQTVRVIGVAGAAGNVLAQASDWEVLHQPSGPEHYVPEAKRYAHLYTIDIQPNMNIGLKDGTDYVNKVDPAGYAAAHPVDNSAKAPKEFSRVGYFLELVDRRGKMSWAWTSFDAFSSDFADFDLPTANPNHPLGGYVNGRTVTNLDVASNVDGIVTGRSLSGGVIEFSPWNYGGNNVRRVPNATGVCDFGDELFLRVNNYGCMQVGNAEARQIVWAVNKFNGRGVSLGIGNSKNADGHIDYTYDNNANDYASRLLYVLVKPIEKPHFEISIR